MTFLNKAQRIQAAFKAVLPTAPVKTFHTSSLPRFNPLRNAPAALLPLQQRTAIITTRAYSSDNPKIQTGFTPLQKSLIGFGAGALCTEMFMSTAFAMEMPEKTTASSPSVSLDHTKAVHIFNQIESELPELSSGEIAEGLSFLYFFQFSDEDAFDRHLITFAQSVDRYNETRSEKDPYLTLGEAFNAYRKCREWIIIRLHESNEHFGYEWFSWCDRKLTYVPPEIATLKNIGRLYLNFQGCRIAALPDQLKELAPTLLGIQFLDATFETIPSVIFKLTELTEFKSINGPLHKISSEISKLQNLEYLDLSYNKIGNLPAEIQGLRKLKELKMTPTPPFFLKSDKGLKTR